jgi:formylglycine-generating enzyme required for sulfatase activity
VKVATYPPNGYGLYDMAGNVFDWVGDWPAKYLPQSLWRLIALLIFAAYSSISPAP